MKLTDLALLADSLNVTFTICGDSMTARAMYYGRELVFRLDPLTRA